jgi:hypothetical protein
MCLGTLGRASPGASQRAAPARLRQSDSVRASEERVCAREGKPVAWPRGSRPFFGSPDEGAASLIRLLIESPDYVKAPSRPDVAQVEQFLRKMHKSNPDFVWSVTRNCLKQCMAIELHVRDAPDDTSY